MRPAIRVRIYDKALGFLYPLSNGKLAITPRHQAMGQATIEVPADHERAADLLTPGRRATFDYFTGTDYASDDVYFWPDDPAGAHWMRLMSGPLWSFEGTSGGDETPPSLTFTVNDDVQILSWLLGSPQPGGTIPGTLTPAHDVRTGSFETVAKGYVNANKAALVAGDTQHYAVPLTVATDAHRGATVKTQSRFDPLDALLWPLAVTANMGMRVVQDGASLVFDVYEPVDRTSRPLTYASGAVTTWDVQSVGPTVNDVVLGDGSGSSTTRVFSEQKAGDVGKSWPLIRGFVDASDTTDSTTLTQQGQSALDAGAPAAGIAVGIAETDVVRFGKNLNVSDLVTVDLAPGLIYTDYISEATITSDPDTGLLIAPQVGQTAAATHPDYKLAQAIVAARNQIGKIGRA